MGARLQQRGCSARRSEGPPLELNTGARACSGVDERSDVRSSELRRGPPEGEGGASTPLMLIGSNPDQTRKLWRRCRRWRRVRRWRPAARGNRAGATTSPSGAGATDCGAALGRGRRWSSPERVLRWRMMQASTDRSYEFSRGQVHDGCHGRARAGVDRHPRHLRAWRADRGHRRPPRRRFSPVPDAQVEATLTSPGGETSPLSTLHA